MEQFLSKREGDILADTEIDVDEDTSPPIIGFCTPVKGEDIKFNISPTNLSDHQKTTKPIAVDSAIANSVWDTIIEEEEGEADVEKVSYIGWSNLENIKHAFVTYIAQC